MKKLYSLLVILLLYSNIHAQLNGQFSLTLQNLQFDTIGDYTRLSFPNCDIVKEPGHPELPYKMVNYLIPYDKKVGSITISNTSSQMIEGNYLLYPAQPDYPINELPPAFVEPDSIIYNSNAIYPNGLVEIAGQYYDKNKIENIEMQYKPLKLYTL